MQFVHQHFIVVRLARVFKSVYSVSSSCYSAAEEINSCVKTSQKHLPSPAEMYMVAAGENHFYSLQELDRSECD